MRLGLKSKIHRATVTNKDLEYVGSIVIDRALMEVADLITYEQVQLCNLHNGLRWETYVIEGDPGSGIISVQGPAARLCEVGDPLVILAYTWADTDAFTPKKILVDAQNQVVSTL